MNIRKTLVSIEIMIAMTGFILGPVQARTWTSSDGKSSFDGELKAYDPGSGKLTVVRADGRELTFGQEKLSPADIEFLKSAPATPLTPSTTEAPKTGGLSSAKSTTHVKSVPQEVPPYDGKEADVSKPVKVFIMMGQSNMVGLGKVVPEDKKGSLAYYCKQEKKYPYLLAADGGWVERKDICCAMLTCDQNSGWLRPGFGAAGGIGPELGFGWVVATGIEEPVLLLKACIGNRSLGWDLLPPGSPAYEFEGKTYPGYLGTASNPKGTDGPSSGEWYAGKQYDEDTSYAKSALSKISAYYPGVSKYEVAGFVFWQGEKDGGNAGHANFYEKNLVQFIKQLRVDFEAPNAKFVLGTLGEAKKDGGKGNGALILSAQLAVDGATGKYREFKGNVATVYTNPLSNGGSGNGHYNGDAGTYMNVGEAMGRAMLDLLKGK